MPMTKKEKADAMKRLQNLNAFKAKMSVSPVVQVKSRGRKSKPVSAPRVARAVSPRPVRRRRAGSVPVMRVRPSPVFMGPMMRPQGYVQPVQVPQVPPPLPPRTYVSAKQLARRQEKQRQHAELRARAYDAAPAELKKSLDFMSSRSDLSGFNALMDKLAQQQEQRQVAQRLAKAKQHEEGVKRHGALNWELMSKVSAKAKAREQAAELARGLAQMRPQGPRSGQSMQAFKLRKSRQAAQERSRELKVRDELAAKKAARRQEKQRQHAELRARAYNAASSDLKSRLDYMSRQSDLSGFNALMDKLAKQQEQRQVAQRLAASRKAQMKDLPSYEEAIGARRPLVELGPTTGPRVPQLGASRVAQLSGLNL